MNDKIDKHLLPPEQFQIMRYTEENFIRIGHSHVNYFTAAIDIEVLSIIECR